MNGVVRHIEVAPEEKRSSRSERRPHLDNAPRRRTWKSYHHSLYASAISTAVRFYDRFIQCAALPHDNLEVFHLVDCPVKELSPSVEALPDLTGEREKRTAIFLNANFNHSLDIETDLRGIRQKMSRSSRLFVLLFNPYYRFLYQLTTFLRLRSGPAPQVFLTRPDLEDICRASGLEIVRLIPCGYFPFRLLGIGTLINAFSKCIPGWRWMSLGSIAVLRSVASEASRPSLSVVIPARNEKGNIRPALKRLSCLEDIPLEVIFVEGHSTDGTWEEIQRVITEYKGPYTVKCVQQQGKGKVDAVRLGFGLAQNDLLTILDADLTMPPERLRRFYDAYANGLADFVNGSRLVYPQENDAMRFLNKIGNIFYAKALSWVLDQRLSDSLCGTKLMARHDYERMRRWREQFGDFDPFGDFELLFPAGIMALGVINIPVRYLSRTYGSTNIHRFRHGLILLRMTLIGFFRIKLRN